MNRDMGTKWFTFYTKVRPIISCIFSLPFIFDVLTYPGAYFSTLYLSLYAIAGLLSVVLSVMVFVKSRGDYIDFVRFVKGVLLFEIISGAYQSGVNQYVNTQSLLGSLISFAIHLLIMYFLWYRLNLKYFEKRILHTPYTSKFNECQSCGHIAVFENKCPNCGHEQQTETDSPNA